MASVWPWGTPRGRSNGTGSHWASNGAGHEALKPQEGCGGSSHFHGPLVCVVRTVPSPVVARTTVRKSRKWCPLANPSPPPFPWNHQCQQWDCIPVQLGATNTHAHTLFCTRCLCFTKPGSHNTLTSCSYLIIYLVPFNASTCISTSFKKYTCFNLSNPPIDEHHNQCLGGHWSAHLCPQTQHTYICGFFSGYFWRIHFYQSGGGGSRGTRSEMWENSTSLRPEISYICLYPNNSKWK